MLILAVPHFTFLIMFLVGYPAALRRLYFAHFLIQLLYGLLLGSLFDVYLFELAKVEDQPDIELAKLENHELEVEAEREQFLDIYRLQGFYVSENTTYKKS